MRSSIAKMVQSAIKTVGDIAETLTYNAKTTGVYDPDTGNVSDTTTSYTFNAVVSSTNPRLTAENALHASEVREGITADLTCLFASIDLPITPDTNDTITRGLETYKITKIAKDPAGASTTLYMVRIG